ncbi:MAG: DNA repair protein RecO [Chloroflexi bacterium]|nr:DNA repair protein RecO [Chloroflexota bacterium]
MPRQPRVYKSSAIVLRQRGLGDVDKIITLYTAEYGKLDAVAKGVRRVKSRLAGHVEPFSHCSYLLARGRNLDIITQAQTIETFLPLRDDLGRLSHALYAVELVERGTEERSENFALYRLLLDTLRRLAQRDDLDTILRFFEMAALGQLGYRPELGQCVVCGRPPEAEASVWAPGLGGVVCSRCRPGGTLVRRLSGGALDALRLLQGGDFEEVARLQQTPELADELERHLRDAIHYALERDVRSAAFLQTVRRSPIRSAGRSAGLR